MLFLQFETTSLGSVDSAQFVGLKEASFIKKYGYYLSKLL